VDNLPDKKSFRRLQGKSALVIGAGSGIGEAVCRAFAAEGSGLVVADRLAAEDRVKVVAAAAAFGVEAADVECDVTDEAAVAAAVETAVKRFGKLDIVVNNAGVGGAVAPFEDQDWTAWAQMIDINLRGIAYGIKHALRHMLPRRSGRIINTASQLAHKPAPGVAAYCASKAGVVALTVSVAHEVAARGVTVNCVCPGPTDTPMWQATEASWRRWKASELPLKRVGRPEEVAAAYVFLASDEASYMIGQSISPNGGDVSW
jgi:NAD(P)-dependent dehydrogenase (short-subunit alcohol dehydrogenase family)